MVGRVKQPKKADNTQKPITSAVTGDGYAIRLYTKYFYCDDKHHNVAVYVLYVHTQPNVCLISGDSRELRGSCWNARGLYGDAYKVVDSFNLYCNLQPE